MSNSASQCHNCRKRRIRCDSTRPTCKKCAQKGIDCLGYGKQKPLVWLQDGGYQNQYLSEGNKPPSQRKPRKSGRPRLIVAKDETPSTENALICANAPVDQTESTFSGAPASLDLRYPMDVELVVSSLCYYQEKIYPDINPLLLDRTIPSLNVKAWQEDVTNLFLHIIVAVSAAHKAVQSRGENGAVYFSREVYQYRSHALQRLNQQLRDPKTQLDDFTLLCVLSLQLAEFQQSATGGWFAHFEGAKRMIELKGGISAVASQKPFLHPLLRYFMLTDVLSLTTSQAVSMPDACQQLEYSPLLDELFRDGTETCVPFSSELFDAVIQINHLRALSHHSISDDTSGLSFATSVQALLERLLTFSTTEWAKRKALEYGATDAVILEKPRPGFIQPTQDNWLRIATLYQSATILYALRSLALDLPSLLLSRNPSDPECPHISAEDLHETTRQKLYHDIHEIFTSPDENQRVLRKVLVWPLFIAGIEAGDYDDAADEREFIASSLRSLTVYVASLNLRDAEAFLRCYWYRNSSRAYPSCFYDRRRWDDIFTGVTGRCAFFM